MALTLLQVVTRFCERTNLDVPATVIGSVDPLVVQIRALLEEIGIDMSGRGAWQGLTFEKTHTTLALEDQGAIDTIASNGFRYIKNQTIWDRTDQLPVTGPMSAQEWQALKAVVNTGPHYQFRIRGGKLLSNPAPPAGHTWAFEYVSKNWILQVDGTTYLQFFAADTDTILFPDYILLQGLRWVWKREKGFDYSEDFRSYELMLKDALGRDGGKPVLDMSGGGRSIKPGIWVSPGSWAV
jgi:hypothetical protein